MDDLAVVIVAGGSARRFGGNKLLLELDGLPLFLHCVRRFLPAAAPGCLVVVHPRGGGDEFRLAAERFFARCPDRLDGGRRISLRFRSGRSGGDSAARGDCCHSRRGAAAGVGFAAGDAGGGGAAERRRDSGQACDRYAQAQRRKRDDRRNRQPGGAVAGGNPAGFRSVPAACRLCGQSGGRFHR